MKDKKNIQEIYSLHNQQIDAPLYTHKIEWLALVITVLICVTRFI